jgi:hypothetical protein
MVLGCELCEKGRGGGAMSTMWRETADGERQWLGADGNWYSTEALARSTHVARVATRIPAAPAAAVVQSPAPRSTPAAALPRRRRMRPFFVVLVLLVIVIAVIVAASSGGGKGASFTSRIGSITAPTPKTVVIILTVTNTGSAAGKPTCHVFVDAPTGADGFDDYSLTKTVAPGASRTGPLYLRITTTRATRITRTEITIKC